MDEVLARLEAESAIRRLVARYCDAVNRRDADAAGQLFAADCRITIAGGPERLGRELHTEGMRQTFAAFAFLRQQCDSGLIDVAGDAATARLSVFEKRLHLIVNKGVVGGIPAAAGRMAP